MGFFDADLSYPTVRTERRKNKRARLVQGPNSYFMDVKCPSCFNITTVYSHASSQVSCNGCSTVIARSTGGKAKLSEGASFRKKADH